MQANFETGTLDRRTIYLPVPPPGLQGRFGSEASGSSSTKELKTVQTGLLRFTLGEDLVWFALAANALAALALSL